MMIGLHAREMRRREGKGGKRSRWIWIEWIGYCWFLRCMVYVEHEMAGHDTFDHSWDI